MAEHPSGPDHRRSPAAAARGFLERKPIASSIAYTVVGVFTLYVTAAQSVRLQEELGFGRPEFGLVVASFFLVSSVTSKQVGPVLDRRGPAFGYRYAGLIALVGALVALVATSWVVLAVALAVAGLANAFGQVASNLVIATVVGTGRQGLAFAAKQSAVPVGAMLAGLAVPWVGLEVGWRVPYVVAAGLGLLMAVGAPRFATLTPSGTVERGRITPALAAFMLAAAIGGGIGNSVSSFVSDASVTRGLAQSTGARILTMGSFVAIITRLAIGAIADRRARSGVAELSTLLGVAVVGLLVLGASGGSTALFVIGVALAFAGSWGWQGVMFYTVVHIIRLPAATATGAVAAGAYLGTVLLPPLIGYAVDLSSYETVFLGAAGLMVVAIGAVALSRRLSLTSDYTSIDAATRTEPRDTPGTRGLTTGRTSDEEDP